MTIFQAQISDITTLAVDAIVNAANTTLLGGGGVDGAIHRVAGPKLVEACCQLNGCATGEAKLTQGYQLAASYVIHTVGPVWRGGEHQEAELLACCYQNSLQLAIKHHITTIAFPAISCGVYRFPLKQACYIAITICQQFANQHPEIQQIIFACFDDTILQCYQQQLKDLDIC